MGTDADQILSLFLQTTIHPEFLEQKKKQQYHTILKPFMFLLLTIKQCYYRKDSFHFKLLTRAGNEQ